MGKRVLVFDFKMSSMFELMLDIDQEEWRIETPKIQLLFLKICPTIDMKIISKTNGGEAYPCHVPHYIPKLLHFQMVILTITFTMEPYYLFLYYLCFDLVVFLSRQIGRSMVSIKSIGHLQPMFVLMELSIDKKLEQEAALSFNL